MSRKTMSAIVEKFRSGEVVIIFVFHSLTLKYIIVRIE